MYRYRGEKRQIFRAVGKMTGEEEACEWTGENVERDSQRRKIRQQETRVQRDRCGSYK